MTASTMRCPPAAPQMPRPTIRCGVVLEFKKREAPAPRHRAPADRIVFQVRQGGAWHEFVGFNGTKPVSKCGRDGWPNAKTREGQADCGDCAAKGTK